MTMMCEIVASLGTRDRRRWRTAVWRAAMVTMMLVLGFGCNLALKLDSLSVDNESNSYTVGGTVTGLTGSGLVLQVEAGNIVSVTKDGPFVFPTPLPTGTSFQITALTQPINPSQTCAVSYGDTIVEAAPVTNVIVVCSNASYTLGGAVAGLASPAAQDAGGQSITTIPLILQNTDGQSITVTSSAFQFPIGVASGQPYDVTIKQNPTGQACQIANGKGEIASQNVSNIIVTCQNLTSCQQLITLNPAATTGMYAVYLGGLTTPLPVYCFMGGNPYVGVSDLPGDPTVTPGGWTLILNQDMTQANSILSPASSWLLVNPTQPSAGVYSILSYIAQIKSGAQYEFYLTWPVGPLSTYSTGYLWWQQVENPTSGPNPPTMSLLVQSPPNQFGAGPFVGLTTVNCPTYDPGSYLCSVNNADWFAVGTAAVWIPGYIPAFAQYTGDAGATVGGTNGGSVHAQLWLR